jgi:mono/diheme cytochrome c family protein
VIGRYLRKLAPLSYETALQVALVAGEIQGQDSLLALKQVLIAYGDKPWVKEAAISGLAGREQEFSDVLLSHENTKTDFDNSDFITMLNSVGKAEVETSNFANLTPEHQLIFQQGKSLYEGKAACFGCHGKDGQGIDNMGPPLVASEWVIGDSERLQKVLLHGLMGPIMVNNQQYNLSMVMPGFNANLNDKELVEVSTYIRNNWGNTGPVIPASNFNTLRDNTFSRQIPYTQKEFAQQ